MGISDFLGRVLRSAGNDVDLREYRDGIDVVTTTTSITTTATGSNRTGTNSSSTINKKKRKRCHDQDGHSVRRIVVRRPLRIAVDVSHWIYKACYRYGSMLAEENHLTNFGRYQLVRNMNNNNDKENDDNIHNGNNNNNARQQEENCSKNKSNNNNATNSLETIEFEYVTCCVLFVIERLVSLQRETNGEILVVLDGATPPIKVPTTKKRSDIRQENIRQRDEPIDITTVSKPTSVTVSVPNNDGSNNEGNDNDSSINDDNDTILEEQLYKRLKANRRAGACRRLFSIIIEELLLAMRMKQMPFLVAPYEADGQLAWLSQNDYVDLIITEDSDLSAQGAKSILYKMDISTPTISSIIDKTTSTDSNNQLTKKNSNIAIQNSTKEGEADDETKDDDRKKVLNSIGFTFAPKGKLLNKEDLGAVIISRYAAGNDDKGHLTLRDMSDAVLAVMFVAAGSDYCESLKGIGLVTACEIVVKSFLKQKKVPPLAMVFDRLFQRTSDRHFQGDPNRQEEYKIKFLEALLMYRHPIVYSPFTCCYVIAGEKYGDPELMNYPPYKQLFEDSHRRTLIVGDTVKEPLATLIAEGWVSPRTKQLYESAKKNYSNLPVAAKLYYGLEENSSSDPSNTGADDQAHELNSAESPDDEDSESNNFETFHDAEELDNDHLLAQTQAETMMRFDVAENTTKNARVETQDVPRVTLASMWLGMQTAASLTAEVPNSSNEVDTQNEDNTDVLQLDTQEDQTKVKAFDQQMELQKNRQSGIEGISFSTKAAHAIANAFSQRFGSLRDTQSTVDTINMRLESQEEPNRQASNDEESDYGTPSGMPQTHHFFPQNTQEYEPQTQLPQTQQQLSIQDIKDQEVSTDGEFGPQTQLPDIQNLFPQDAEDQESADEFGPQTQLPYPQQFFDTEDQDCSDEFGPQTQDKAMCYAVGDQLEVQTNSMRNEHTQKLRLFTGGQAV